MKNQKSILLVLSSGGMALSCFYACTSFIFACLSQKPVSVSEATVILFLATLITYIYHQKGWRRIYVIGLHILGFLFASLRLCHRYYELDLPFWRFGWISELFMLDQVAAAWPILILILLCAWILWFCGIRMITRPTDQTIISHRFDTGLAFLLFLLLIKLIIAVKGASIPMEHSSIKSIFSFIIIGLFSMGLVRTGSSSQTGGITYLKGAGIVLSFVFITLMLGGGLFILFLPELQALAETGAGLLGAVKEPIGRLLIMLGMPSYKFGASGGAPAGGSMPTINQPGGASSGIHYFFISMIIMVSLAVVGFILYRLLRWLFSRTATTEKDNKGLWERLLSWIGGLKIFLSTLCAKIFHSPDTLCAAEKFYRRLLLWGRFSGLCHGDTETPREYGIRLGRRFPKIEKEIRHIIHMHDEVIYGYISLDEQQISRAKLALKRIRTPLLWFARIKSLCFDHRQLQ